jgi:hypothetical protein
MLDLYQSTGGGAILDLYQSTGKEGLCLICTRVQGWKDYVRSVPEYREGGAMLDMYQSIGKDEIC